MTVQKGYFNVEIAKKHLFLSIWFVESAANPCFQ